MQIMRNIIFRIKIKNYNINKIPDDLFELGVKKHFPKGINIYKVNERITHCYLILSGMVKIYIDHENGRRSILDFNQLFNHSLKYLNVQ